MAQSRARATSAADHGVRDARRLKHEGSLTMAWRYALNYFWTTFRKKPYTDEYTDIREQSPAATESLPAKRPQA